MGKIPWEKIEKFFTYLIIILFFVLEFLAIFIPTIRQQLDNGASFLLIALILLLIFRYLDKNITEKKGKGIVLSNSFNDAVSQLINENDQIDTIDIFAFSSVRYCFSIVGGIGSKNIGCINLLLFNPEACSDSSPCSINEKSEVEGEINDTISRWEEFENAHNTNIQITKYNFFPQLHFMIVNKKIAMIGLFHPQESSRYVDLGLTFIVFDDTYEGQTIIGELIKFFNKLIEVYRVQ
jgi:hypothetical protein